MLSIIVLLYMVYTLGMPKWCAWFMWIVMAVKIIKLFYDLWQKGREYGKGEVK